MADRYTGAAADSGEIDRQIDAAIAKYAAVEPRAGLEDRILASMRAEQAKIPERAWWKWALPAAALFLAVAAWWLGNLQPRSAAHQVPMFPESGAPVQKPAATVEAANAQNSRVQNFEVHHAVRRRAIQTSLEQAKADPKLVVFPSAEYSGYDSFPSPQPDTADVFPAPRPLGAKELALARYISNFRADAELTAQAQQSSEKEVTKEMQALANESTESN